MIASRRIPNDTRSSTCSPQPSGPRWAMRSSIDRSRSGSDPRNPAMPHTTVDASPGALAGGGRTRPTPEHLAEDQDEAAEAHDDDQHHDEHAPATEREDHRAAPTVDSFMIILDAPGFGDAAALTARGR